MENMNKFNNDLIPNHGVNSNKLNPIFCRGSRFPLWCGPRRQDGQSFLQVRACHECRISFLWVILVKGHDMDYIARHYHMDLALARPPRLSGQSISSEASRSDCYCLALPGRCCAGSRWRAGLRACRLNLESRRGEPCVRPLRIQKLIGMIGLIKCLNNLRKPARYACATYQSRRNGVVH